MNALESQIFYPDLPIPPGGSLTPIADRIFWLRMPLPFALDHINLWLIDDELDGQRGWTVVDTGVATP
ncbi:MAG: MBL fold metallo-hydrolase, partial [Burkholderiaceae bacterium]